MARTMLAGAAIAAGLLASAGLAMAQGNDPKLDELIAAARREGSVTILAPPDPTMRQVLPAAFKARYGVDIEYLGGLRTQAKHSPSASTLLTDAPVDNHGKGESFSPTDLCATAFGTCMVTVMGIYAERHGIDLRGTTVRVEKEMIAAPVRRIGVLRTEIRVPLAPDHPQREALERAALTCPVHQSLHPDVEKPVTFVWTA